jgi:hypothetical protein
MPFHATGFRSLLASLELLPTSPQLRHSNRRRLFGCLRYKLDHAIPPKTFLRFPARTHCRQLDQKSCFLQWFLPVFLPQISTESASCMPLGVRKRYFVTPLGVQIAAYLYRHAIAPCVQILTSLIHRHAVTLGRKTRSVGGRIASALKMDATC